MLDELAQGGRVIAPSHPGFGTSQLPKGMNTVDDLSYFYLDLLEQLDLRDVLVVGVGLGGWIAAEIAVKDHRGCRGSCLANAVGVKIGDRETRDIVDIWSLMPDEFNALAYFDPKRRQARLQELPEAGVLAAARNREAYARARLVALHAQPQAQEPAAPHHAADAVPVGHGRPHPERELRPRLLRADCRRADSRPIERAGHFPHIEQPDGIRPPRARLRRHRRTPAPARAEPEGD